jgi:hypothetical protein
MMPGELPRAREGTRERHDRDDQSPGWREGLIVALRARWGPVGNPLRTNRSEG